MKAVILAGGLGTRISEETTTRPKPMIEIGGHPMLWHIMKIYAAHGVTDFVVCLGYKGFVIKEYFLNYRAHNSDLTIELGNGHVKVHQTVTEPWSVTLVDTGDETMTGGRLRRARPYLDNETFCCTYGDGVADLDVTAAIAQHRASGKAATLAAVRPPGRFGALAVEGRTVTHFVEKPDGDGGWINGGFFVIEPDALDRVVDDATVWEAGPLQSLAADGHLGAYFHDGFWHPLDTLRDKMILEGLWAGGNPPWRIW